MDTENNYNYEEDEDNLYEKLQKENEEYVKIFESDLLEKGLSAKTVNRHISNIDFYLNHFLLYGDLIPMKHGCGMVDAFLGEFFIRKCSGFLFLYGTEPVDGAAVYDHDDGRRAAECGQELLRKRQTGRSRVLEAVPVYHGSRDPTDPSAFRHHDHIYDIQAI